MSYRIAGGDFDTAGIATRQLKEQLAKIGVNGAVMRRAMIASYEAEMNVVIHARTGTLWARLDAGKLDLEVADEGPGIPDVSLALREGWSTASAQAREMGFGAGMGLPNIKRNSDLFEIETRVGPGNARTVHHPPCRRRHRIRGSRRARIPVHLLHALPALPAVHLRLPDRRPPCPRPGTRAPGGVVHRLHRLSR